MIREKFTRGEGLLENFLAQRRFLTADRLILPQHREGRVLDIGCGAIPYFLLHTKFKEKHGLDPNVRVEDAQKLGDTITFHKIMFGKGTCLPFGPATFSTVTMLGVVEHFRMELFVDLLKEIQRILIPQGRFILTTPSPWTGPLLKVMAKFSLISIQEIEGISTHYSKRALQSCFGQADFDIQTMQFSYFQMFFNSWAVIIK